MGNVACCKSNAELGDAELTEISKKETSEIEPQVSRIQNTYRLYKSKKNFKQKSLQSKEEFERKLSEHGKFITTEEMEALINPTVLETDKQLTATTELPENIYKYSFTLPPIKFNNGNIYSGNWNYNGKKEGFGINLKPDGSLYKGYWENDQISKYGTFIEPKGNYYQGEFKGGVSEGKGVLYIKDKMKYTGEFKNDLQNGKGVEENYEDNTVYEGDFVNGIREGIGKLKFNDGTVYEGEFKKGQFNGKGILKFCDNKQYEGEFKDGKMNGQGTFTWENGSKYIGEYVNGFKQGYGSFYWNDDQYYDGYWMNNKQHGEGCLHLNDKQLKGQFRFGKIIMKK